MRQSSAKALSREQRRLAIASGNTRWLTGRDPAYSQKYIRSHVRIEIGHFIDPPRPVATGQFTAILAATQSPQAGRGEQYKPCAVQAERLSAGARRAISGVMDVDPAAIRRRPSRFRLILILVLTATLAAGLCLHLPGMNGPAYWRWPWRRLDAG